MMVLPMNIRYTNFILRKIITIFPKHTMNNKIIIVEQKIIDFYDDDLIAVRAKDGQVYASLKHMCESIGVARQSQARRVRQHHVLSKGYTGGTIILPPERGGPQDAGLLRVDLIPMWLSGIDIKRVREEIRPKLIRYQEEVAKVLWEAFQTGELSVDETFSDLLKQGGEAVEAYKTLQGMLKLAKHQIILQARISNTETRLDAIEAELGNPARLITHSQQMELSQAIMTTAHELGKRSGKNEYKGVYGELYRRFEIASYKQLPSARFDEAMNWIRDWYTSLFGNTPF